jgi:hypothetical protein
MLALVSFTFVSLNMASPSPSIVLPTQLEYYAIRDTLLGRNGVKQDVKRALDLASTCQHLQARWLTEIFAGKDVNTREGAREVFKKRVLVESIRAS